MGSEPNFIKPSLNHDIITPLPHTFLTPNITTTNQTNPGKNPLLQNIEMVPLQSLTYTSLRDLLPATPPGSIIWPTYNDRKDSWREIPIKNPLLQHAAWAYLQPMTVARDHDGNRSILGKLMDGFFKCFGGFLESVVAWATPVEESAAFGSENVDDGDVDFSIFWRPDRLMSDAHFD